MDGSGCVGRGRDRRVHWNLRFTAPFNSISSSNTRDFASCRTGPELFHHGYGREEGRSLSHVRRSTADASPVERILRERDPCGGRALNLTPTRKQGTVVVWCGLWIASSFSAWVFRAFDCLSAGLLVIYLLFLLVKNLIVGRFLPSSIAESATRGFR